MALTTLTATKSFIGIASSNHSEDDFITQALTALDQAFKNLVGRDIEQQNYSEYYSGRGTINLPLNQFPVNYITAIYEDDGTGNWGQTSGGFGSAKLLVEGTDYALVKSGPSGVGDFGLVQKINGSVWENRWVRQTGRLSPFTVPGQGNIWVQYNAGYSTIPADIPLAIWQAVAIMRASRGKGFIVTSQSYEGYSWSIADAKTALQTIGGFQQIVTKYRRKSVGV